MFDRIRRLFRRYPTPAPTQSAIFDAYLAAIKEGVIDWDCDTIRVHLVDDGEELRPGEIEGRNGQTITVVTDWRPDADH